MFISPDDVGDAVIKLNERFPVKVVVLQDLSGVQSGERFRFGLVL